MVVSRFAPRVARGLLLISGLVLQGCSTISPPTPLFDDPQVAPLGESSPPSGIGVDVNLAFNRALKDAQSSTTDDAKQRNLLTEGLALVEYRCNRYFEKLGFAQQDLSFTRKQTGLTAGLLSGMLGLANATPKFIANTGSLFSFSVASMESYQDVYLFSPEVKTVQKLVTSALDAYRRKLSEDFSAQDSGRVSYSQVMSILSHYESFCRPHGIRDLVNQSLTQSKGISDPSPVETITKAAVRAAAARAVEKASISDEELLHLFWYTYSYDASRDKDALVGALKGVPVVLTADGKDVRIDAGLSDRLRIAFASLTSAQEAAFKGAIAASRAATVAKASKPPAATPPDGAPPASGTPSTGAPPAAPAMKPAAAPAPKPAAAAPSDRRLSITPGITVRVGPKD